MSTTTDPTTMEVFEEIMLHKPPPLKLKHARIPIDKVHFDPQNPRLKYKKQLHPDALDKDLLFAEPDTNWLLKDVQEKGIIEPIYVKPQHNNGEWIVVEGNRRTAVVQELHVKFPENASFAVIPARVLPGEVTAEQEALLMASCHVAGKVKWEAHEKAGHIWHMINELRIPESELISTLHMGAASVKKAAESYGLLEHFKKIDGGKYVDQAEGKWSFFAEMLRIKEFREKHIKEGQDWDDQFCRWVGDKRIPRSENVRDLEAILKKPKAKALFLDEPVETAFIKAKKEVDHATPSRNSKFYKDLEHIIGSGKSASLGDLDSARDNDAARETVQEAYSVIRSFMERAGVNIPSVPRR